MNQGGGSAEVTGAAAHVEATQNMTRKRNIAFFFLPRSFGLCF